MLLRIHYEWQTHLENWPLLRWCKRGVDGTTEEKSGNPGDTFMIHELKETRIMTSEIFKPNWYKK